MEGTRLVLTLMCDRCGSAMSASPADLSKDGGLMLAPEAQVLYHMRRLEDRMKTHLCLPAAPEHPTEPEAIG